MARSYFPDGWRLALNAVGYQAVWAAAVLGAAAGYAALGPLVALGFIASQLALSPVPRRDLTLVALSAALGLVLDSAQAAAGVFAFQTAVVPAWLSPPWLLSIWAAFGTTLNGCLRWLQGRPWLAAALGAAGGALAYWSGARLEAISLQWPPGAAMILLAVVWAAVTPLLAGVAAWLNAERTRVPGGRVEAPLPGPGLGAEPPPSVPRARAAGHILSEE